MVAFVPAMPENRKRSVETGPFLNDYDIFFNKFSFGVANNGYFMLPLFMSKVIFAGHLCPNAKGSIWQINPGGNAVYKVLIT